LALWDRHNRRLLLARSPFAEQTLFYFETKDVFAFATRPKGLFSLPGVSRQANERYVAAYLTLIDNPHDETFLKT